MNILLVLLLLITSVAGCVKNPKSPALKACEDQVNKLNIDVQAKNDRLRAFNQLDADNNLREKK